jgi:DNA-binding Lrp family transcriptional regulator
VGDAAAPEEKLPEKQEEILAVLEETGPDGMRLKDIAERMNKSRQAVTGLLNNMERREMVINAGRGLWALPQNVKKVNMPLGTSLQSLQIDSVKNVNECKHVYKSLQDEGAAVIPFPEANPIETTAGELDIW